MQDGPDEQDAAGATPDPAPRQLPVFHALDDLPPAPPQVELINDSDLSWVDKPEISEEERARRRERRDLRRKKVHRQRRNRRLVKVAGVLLATFLVLGCFWLYWALSGLQRMPTVSEHGGQNTPGANILLIGRNPAESEDPDAPGRGGWQNAMKASDLVMVLHLTRDNRAMFAVSIPGDSVVPIPGNGSEPPSQGKLSDAYATGGQNLYVRTIEDFTGARMDRVAVLDMTGLGEITDHLGGVNVDIPNGDCGLQPGRRRLDGASALEYVALNTCLTQHDLDRVQRQQSLLRGLMRTAVDGNRINNPFTLSRLLKATAGHLTLEEDFSYPSMFGTMFSMRGLRSSTTTFLTIPTAADAFADGDDSVLLDAAGDEELFEALRSDKLGEYLALNKDISTQ